jgi:hypothetical protein
MGANEPANQQTSLELGAAGELEASASRRSFLAGTTMGAIGMMAGNAFAGGLPGEPQVKSEQKAVDLNHSLSITSELAQFVRAAEEKLRSAKLETGQDLEPMLEKAGVRIPDWLRGAGIAYEPASAEKVRSGESGLVIVTPGDPRILAIRIFCVCIKKWNVCVCLECGWIWCRIVIVGRF